MADPEDLRRRVERAREAAGALDPTPDAPPPEDTGPLDEARRAQEVVREGRLEPGPKADSKH